MEYLKLAIAASLAAGKEIMAIYEGEIAFELKQDQSPLTMADNRSNEVIKDFLMTTELPIMSEEDSEIPYEIRKHWDRYWLVDPLDGTKEFIKKNGQFTVNIALVEFGIPVIGVVYAPAIGEIYWTGKDHLSYYSSVQNIETEPSKLFESTHKIKASKQSKPYKVVKSLSHNNASDEIKLTELLKGKTDVEIIEMGSSLKICLVAKGIAQMYPRFGPTMEWDTAAGHAIAVNAGCSFLNMETNTGLTYNKISLVNPPFLVEA